MSNKRIDYTGPQIKLPDQGPAEALDIVTKSYADSRMGGSSVEISPGVAEPHSLLVYAGTAWQVVSSLAVLKLRNLVSSMGEPLNPALDGALEYINSVLYVTQGATRKQIALAADSAPLPLYAIDDTETYTSSATTYADKLSVTLAAAGNYYAVAMFRAYCPNGSGYSWVQLNLNGTVEEKTLTNTSYYDWSFVWMHTKAGMAVGNTVKLQYKVSPGGYGLYIKEAHLIVFKVA